MVSMSICLSLLLCYTMHDDHHQFRLTPVGGPVVQLFTRRTIDREVESSNPAGYSDTCHWVAKAGALSSQIPPAPRK